MIKHLFLGFGDVILYQISMMGEKNVLITDKVHPVLIDGLEAMGYTVDYDTSVDNTKLETIIEKYEGLVINSKIIMNRSRIDLGKQLKFIGRLGSGLEIIDVNYAISCGIAVCNSPEGNRNAVAEHEIGMLLALLNNLIQADREVRTMSWNREKNRGRELMGQTIGVIGLGHTGSAFVEKLKTWNVKVLGYDKYRIDYPEYLGFVEQTDLDTLLHHADIISLHLPLTEETKYLVNDAFINKCKEGVIISNTSRGQIIQTEALIRALQSGKIGGACIDVFENEKPETFNDVEREMYYRLYNMENVILTPHIAGWTKESLERIAMVLLNKIREQIA